MCQCVGERVKGRVREKREEGKGEGGRDEVRKRIKGRGEMTDKGIQEIV